MRDCWVRFISNETGNISIRLQGLWRMSRWSRKAVGKPLPAPHLPALRRHAELLADTDNEAKAEIFAEKFFPPPVGADLGDITEVEARDIRQVEVSQEVVERDVLDTLRSLPTQKAPGPDEIPNEALKAGAEALAGPLAVICQWCFQRGHHPRNMRDSTTLVLRKEGKTDYSLPGSYRPIALEDTVSKVFEILIARRLTVAAEANNLLPDTQMGARKQRSTTTALALRTETVHAAWAQDKGNIVSMLSLDLSGAFDKVSHARLLWIMRRKGLPEWVCGIVAGFLTERTTSLRFSGFTSARQTVTSGIPQGSPLSPILFLLFASELLEQFQGRK